MIAFISGLIFISYDDDVTPVVAEKIEVPIGDYIAQEIVNRLNDFGEHGNIIKPDDKFKIVNAP